MRANYTIMTTLIILCAVLFACSILFARHRWYAPTVLATGVWLVSLIAYAWIDHGLHPLTQETCRMVTYWLVFFCVPAWCVQSVYIKPVFKDVKTSVTARDIYYYLSLCTLPVMILTVLVVLSRAGGNPFSALRDANVADMKSLVIHPASTTHSQMTEEQLAASGIRQNTIRLSIGTEHIDDILADLQQAFEQAYA